MRLHIVDVFAETRYAGNQLAVVRDCAALSGEAMQTIAREMNFSETTFVTAETPVAREGADLHAGRRAAVRRTSDDRHGVGVGTHAAELHARTRDGRRRRELRRRGRRCVDDAAEADARRSVSGRTRRAHVAPDGRGPRSASCRRNWSRSGRSSSSSAFAISRRCAAPASTKSISARVAPKACRSIRCFCSRRRRTRPTRTTRRACSSTRTACAKTRPPAARTADSPRICTRILKKPIDVIVEQGFEIKRPSRLYLRADAQQLRVGGRVQAVVEGRLALGAIKRCRAARTVRPALRSFSARRATSRSCRPRRANPAGFRSRWDRCPDR